MSKFGKQIINTAFDSLDLIGELAADATGADPKKAALVLGIIKAIVESIRKGRNREIDPAEVKKQIEESLKLLETTIEQDRKDIRAELDKRFPVARVVVRPGDPT